VETEFVIITLSSILRGLINIKDSPSLVDLVVSLPDNNFLSFSISSSLNIKNLLVVNVDEVLTGVFEDLPPVGVSAVDLDVLLTSISIDVPRIVVVSSLDGQ
jgi:hypothetical protein